MMCHVEPHVCAVMFSGGKDSLLALDRAVRAGYDVRRLVTLYDGPSGRVRFHGVPMDVMRAQAEALGIESRMYATTAATFEAVFLRALADLRADGFGAVVFGNIHLADVRAWYEERVCAAQLAHVEPIWGEEPGRLAREVVARGYRTLLTCVEEARADAVWLGQILTEELIGVFERRGIDVCGERGEYHTLVTNGPLFARPLAIQTGETRAEAGFRMLDVRLAPQGIRVL